MKHFLFSRQNFLDSFGEKRLVFDDAKPAEAVSEVSFENPLGEETAKKLDSLKTKISNPSEIAAAKKEYRESFSASLQRLTTEVSSSTLTNVTQKFNNFFDGYVENPAITGETDIQKVERLGIIQKEIAEQIRNDFEFVLAKGDEEAMKSAFLSLFAEKSSNAEIKVSEISTQIKAYTAQFGADAKAVAIGFASSLQQNMEKDGFSELKLEKVGETLKVLRKKGTEQFEEWTKEEIDFSKLMAEAMRDGVEVGTKAFFNFKFRDFPSGDNFKDMNETQRAELGEAIKPIFLITFNKNPPIYSPEEIKEKITAFQPPSEVKYFAENTENMKTEMQKIFDEEAKNCTDFGGFQISGISEIKALSTVEVAALQAKENTDTEKISALQNLLKAEKIDANAVKNTLANALSAIGMLPLRLTKSADGKTLENTELDASLKKKGFTPEQISALKISLADRNLNHTFGKEMNADNKEEEVVYLGLKEGANGQKEGEFSPSKAEAEKNAPPEDMFDAVTKARSDFATAAKEGMKASGGFSKLILSFFNMFGIDLLDPSQNNFFVNMGRQWAGIPEPSATVNYSYATPEIFEKYIDAGTQERLLKETADSQGKTPAEFSEKAKTNFAKIDAKDKLPVFGENGDLVQRFPAAKVLNVSKGQMVVEASDKKTFMEMMAFYQPNKSATSEIFSSVNDWGKGFQAKIGMSAEIGDALTGMSEGEDSSQALLGVAEVRKTIGYPDITGCSSVDGKTIKISWDTGMMQKVMEKFGADKTAAAQTLSPEKPTAA